MKIAILGTGTVGQTLGGKLTSLGHEVVVANARAVRSIAESDRKTDRSDAEQLARLGRADLRLLRPIRHRSEGAQRHLALLAVRDRLVKTRAALAVQARGLAKALGERLPRCAPEAFGQRLRGEGRTELFPGLSTIVTRFATRRSRLRCRSQHTCCLAGSSSFLFPLACWSAGCKR